MTYAQIVTFVVLIFVLWLIDGLILRFACSCCLKERPTYGKSLLITLVIAGISAVIVFEMERDKEPLHVLIPWLVYLGSAVVIIAILFQANLVSAMKVVATHLLTWFGLTAIILLAMLTVAYTFKNDEPTVSKVSDKELFTIRDSAAGQQDYLAPMSHTPTWVTTEINAGNKRP